MSPGFTETSSPRRWFALLVAIATILITAAGAVLAQPGAAPAGDPEDESAEAEGSAEMGEASIEAVEAVAGARAFAAMRVGPGSASAGGRAYLLARRQVLAMLRAEPVAPGAFEREWAPLGPSNVGGRVRALVVDPRNTDVMYAGGVAGGVWKSQDGGESWSPLTETLSNVGVSSIAMDPQDPDVLYVGTGEKPANRINLQNAFNGVGIMKTTDGGTTWRLLGQTVSDPGFGVVHDIVISANDPDVLYAGQSAGVARSTDGGQTWQTVLDATSVTGCVDLAIRTDIEPDVLLASCADDSPDGVYRSEDGGSTWTKVIDEVNGERAGFAAIAFAPSDQDVAYASVARTWDSPGGSTGTLALLRSEDGGATWSVRNNGSPAWLNWCPEPDGQGSYGNAIAVDPTDADRLWLGGVDAYRSDDGGRTVTIAGYWWLDDAVPVASPGVHADHHQIVFDPNYDGSTNQTVYFANDGGVYRTVNDRAPLPNPECDPNALLRGHQTYDTVIPTLNEVVYEPLNEGLAITQFWAGTVSDDGTMVMGGTQDNGTWIRPGGAGPEGWGFAIGGDGFGVAITPDRDRYYGEVYGSFGITIYRSRTIDPNDFEEVTDGLDDSGLFYTPLELDPNDPDVLWTGGHFLWRTRNGGDLWVATSERLVGQAGQGVSAIAIAPSDSDVIYAGSSTGDLFVTTDGSENPPTWTRLPSQTGYITSIAVHPTDPQIAYATVGWFDAPHVLKTTDGGATWVDVSAALPNVPASSMAINPLNPDMVFVGTDAGVFETPNGGATWFPANGNLASTIVNDLVFRTGTSELYLFTYGRGAYVVDVGVGE